MKPDLKVVKPEKVEYSDDVGRKRIVSLQKSLLREVVRFVVEGKSQTRGDRLREASHLSGIPLTLIDSNSRK